MSRGTKRTLALAACLLGAAALAHIRLQNPSNGAKLHWSSPSAISVVISSAGSADVPNGLHVPALRAAIEAWNGVSGTTEHLVENTSPQQQARTDWASDDLHQILFDETNASGYFPIGTGIVALTPVWFTSDGRITDADVLFNGSGYSFTTSAQPGRYDIEDVATHELGHLLGLDHTGWAGGTMYPYVDTTVVLHRSLSLDEVRGMRAAYPSGVFASITGTVRRQSGGTVVAGAHVVARDAAGRTSAGALANRSGVFQLLGLDAGTYTLYASPLDHPVSAANLGAGNTVAVDFRSTPFGNFAVAAGQALAVGDLQVLPVATPPPPDDPISLGRPSDAFPLRCIAGRTQNLWLRGAGLVPGSSLAASDPTITVTPMTWMTSGVTFQVVVPAGSPPGHVDLTATSPGGDESILPAALEITPASPLVATVAPAFGASPGGTALTITGIGFRAGARVVLGTGVYEDGQPGGCTVVDANTIQLTTAATPPGTCDTVVIDDTGVEGRKLNSFVFTAQPSIASVFPAAGSSAGGTRVVMQGAGFATDGTVTIQGVPQTQVSVEDPSTLSFVTASGTTGGPYMLLVTNPGGASSASSFSFVAAPDPALASIVPVRGSTGGGEGVVLHGANFPPNAEVLFGVDAETGLAGAAAVSVSWIDAGTIDVVSPAHAKGTVAILVRDPATGQATVLADAYTFTSSGGGGGGCSLATSGSGPALRKAFDWRDALAGSGWILVLAAILLGRSRRRPTAAQTA